MKRRTLVTVGLLPLGFGLLASSSQATNSYFYDVQSLTMSITAAPPPPPSIPALCSAAIDSPGSSANAGHWGDLTQITLHQDGTITPALPNGGTVDGLSLDLSGSNPGNQSDSGFLVDIAGGAWNVIGSRHDDVLIGGPQGGALDGGNGKDCLVATGGTTTLEGANAGDRFGATGGTVAFGGNGPDAFFLAGSQIVISGGHAPSACYSFSASAWAVTACPLAAAPALTSTVVNEAGAAEDPAADELPQSDPAAPPGEDPNQK